MRLSSGPHPACLGGANDFALIGDARAAPSSPRPPRSGGRGEGGFFSRAAVVHNHTLHPHEVGGGVTPSIVLSYTIRDTNEALLCYAKATGSSCCALVMHDATGTPPNNENRFGGGPPHN